MGEGRGGVAREGWRADHRLEQHAPDCPHIGAGVDTLATDLLGRDVPGVPPTAAVAVPSIAASTLDVAKPRSITALAAFDEIDWSS